MIYFNIEGNRWLHIWACILRHRLHRDADTLLGRNRGTIDCRARYQLEAKWVHDDTMIVLVNILFLALNMCDIQR